MTFDASREPDLSRDILRCCVFVMFGDVGPPLFLTMTMDRTKVSCAEVQEIRTVGALMCRSVFTLFHSSRAVHSPSRPPIIPRTASPTPALFTLLVDTSMPTPLQCHTQQATISAIGQTNHPVAIATRSHQTISRIPPTYHLVRHQPSRHTHSTTLNPTPHIYLTRPDITTPYL